MSVENDLDPWVEEWLVAHFGTTRIDLVTAAREGKALEFPSAPQRSIPSVVDEVIDGVAVRVYHRDEPPSGLLVYFHGGGFCTGSVDLMDDVARELWYHSGAVVISVEYRLAPQHPHPAAVDDCEAVTRWAQANGERFGVARKGIALAGESAGGSLVAAVSLRLRGQSGPALVAQVLIYPGLDGGNFDHPSRQEFAGLLVSREMIIHFWDCYSAGRDLTGDPTAVPLRAQSLAGLPPALLILGGCDFLRDEGHLYAERLRLEGVEVKEVCYPGQPHGFMNFNFPAAAEAYEMTGRWLRTKLEST
jgi:acetyl esterase